MKRFGVSQSGNTGPLNGVNTSVRNSSAADLATLDKLVTALLERQKQSNQNDSSKSKSFLRQRCTSNQSLEQSSFVRPSSAVNVNNDENDLFVMHSMPTILESNISHSANTGNNDKRNTIRRHSSVRRIIDSIKNAPHRFSHGTTFSSHNNRLVDESSNLTQNVLD